jgi:hypothetical protein
MAELADALDSKSSIRKGIPVRFRVVAPELSCKKSNTLQGNTDHALLVELADTPELGSGAARYPGSNPGGGTNY